MLRMRRHVGRTLRAVGVTLSCALVTNAAAAPARKPPPKVAPGAKEGPVAAPAGSATPEAERLGRGVRLLLTSDVVAAQKELRPLVEPSAHLRNGDYALWALGEAELLDGQAELALTRFDKLARTKSRFANLALARSGDAHRALGHAEPARRAYEAALVHAGTEIDQAAIRFHLAELESTAARQAKAFRQVYVDSPMHPLAETAWQRVLAADSSASVTPAERIKRSKTMSTNRGWPLALEELGKLPGELPAAQRAEADYWFGTTLFHMRRDYEIAASKLLSVWSRMPTEDAKSEALFHGARALSRADHDDEAIAGYRDVLSKFPHGKNAAEASFLIGWLQFNLGRYEDAVPSLEETLKKYGTSKFGDDARWYLGFSRWLDGDATGALADFTRLSEGRGELSAGKGAYFRGLALDKLGKGTDAIEQWKRVAREWPFTHYAMMSRLRLNERSVKLDEFGREAGAAKSSESLAELSKELDRTVTRDPALQRVDELLAANLPVEASYELQRVEGELIRRYTAARALPVLFDRYLRGQDFYRVHRLAENHHGRAPALDPYVAEAARAWWELEYPRAYRSYVEKFAPTGKNPPYYLYTIMQKESAYNPHDVSYADAIGLLQMIPPTSRKVAEHVGVPYTDDVLYDPEGNIRFGSWYIGHLLQKFKGQIPIGAGSYNAGPKAMGKWLTKYGNRPLDEFIELCPYTQTREYMKKAMAIYARYVYLYERQDYLPSMKVDPVWLSDDGIDY